MDVTIEKGWQEQLHDEFKQPYFTELSSKVRDLYIAGEVFPSPAQVFNAFNLCSFDTVKVVILGQDPYHSPGQAHGLSFSVQDGVRTPPSLQNIYKEVQSDIGTPIPASGNLERWAEQGVLLLNSTLTVAEHQAGSHQKLGWEKFTDAVIQTISNEKEHAVFLLWGNYARSKADLIDQKKHLILEAPHPSPLSAHRGFMGCKHFSQTNTYLEECGLTPITW